MLKKISILAICLAVNTANAFSNKDANMMCDLEETRLACMAYVIGITESWRIMHGITKRECKKFKTLSPNMVMAAFQAEYKNLDPEGDNVVHLSKYIIENGGCADSQ